MKWLIVLLLTVAISVANAGLLGEEQVTGDGGIRFIPGAYGGAVAGVDFYANGTAEVTFYKLTSAGAVSVTVPVYGDNKVYLEKDIPRVFDLYPDRVDSCYVNLVTATKVNVTWY